MTLLKNHHPVCFVQVTIELGAASYALEMFSAPQCLSVHQGRANPLHCRAWFDRYQVREMFPDNVDISLCAQQLYPEHERIRYIGGIGVTGAWITVSVKEDR